MSQKRSFRKPTTSCHAETLARGAGLAVFEALEPRLLLSTLYWDPDGVASGNNTTTGEGLGGSGYWDTSCAVWYNPSTGTDVAWNSNYDAVFLDNSCVCGRCVSLADGLVATGVVFKTSDYLLGGGSLSLSGGSETVTVDSGLDATIYSCIAGDDFAKAGAGTLFLGGGNTYDGDTYVRQGTLVLTCDDGLPTGTAVFLGGSSGTSGVLKLDGHSQELAGLATVTGSGTANRVINGNEAEATLMVTVASGQTFTFAGTLGGSGTDDNNFALTKDGPGTLVLTCANTYEGCSSTTIIYDGTLQVGACGLPGDVFNEGTLVFNPSSPWTYSCEICGCGSVVVSGGVMIFTGENTYEGGTTVDEGATLRVGVANLLGDVNVDGTLVFQNTCGDYGGAISGGGLVRVTCGSNVTLSGAITGDDLALTVCTGNEVTLSGTNTYSGVTTVESSAMLQVGTDGLAGDVHDDGELIFDQESSWTYGGVISGDGSVTIADGEVTFSCSNTYKGDTTVDEGGTLQVGTDGLPGGVTVDGTLVFGESSSWTYAGKITGCGSVTVACGGDVALTCEENYYCGDTTVAEGGTLRVRIGSLPGDVTDDGTLVFENVGGTYSGEISGGGTVEVSSGCAVTFDGLITCGVSLVVSGGSDVTLTCESNDYSGGTMVDGGTLRVTTETLPGHSEGGGWMMATLTLGGAGDLDALVSTLESLGISETSWSLSSSTEVAATEDAVLEDVSAVDAVGVIGDAQSEDDPASSTGGARTRLTLKVIGHPADFAALLGSAGARTANVRLVRDGSDTLHLVGLDTVDGGATAGAALGVATNEASGCSQRVCLKAMGGVLRLYLSEAPAVSAIAAGAQDAVDSAAGLTQDDPSVAALEESGGESTGTVLATGMMTLGESADVIISCGGELIFDQDSCGTNDSEIMGDGGGSLTVTGGGEVTLSGAISGTASVTLQESGTLTLSGSNTYEGDTLVQDGTLVLSGGSDRLPTGTTVTLGDGEHAGVLNLGGNDQTLGGLTSEGTSADNRVVGGDSYTTAALTLDMTDDFAFGGILGVGSDADRNLNLVKKGSGTLTLSGQSCYCGSTIIEQGTLALDGGDDRLPTATAVTLGSGEQWAVLRLNGHDQELAGVTASEGNPYNRVENGTSDVATLTLNVSDEVLFGGTLGGPETYDNALALTKTGDGTLILLGPNTYVGGTLIAGGTLQVIPSSLPGDVDNNGALVFELMTTGAYSHDISGEGFVILQGGGTLTFTGQHSYDGRTLIRDGILVLDGGDDRLPTDTEVALGYGDLTGALVLNYNQTLAGLSSVPDKSGNCVASANSEGVTLTLDIPQGEEDAFWGVMEGEITLVKKGPGTSTFWGENTYTGLTTIEDGTLALSGGSNRLPAGAKVVLGDGASHHGILQLNSVSQELAGLLAACDCPDNKVTGGGETTSTLTLNLTTEGTFAGVLGGDSTAARSLSLAKKGSAVLTLSGQSNYDGWTAIEDGTLVLSGGSDRLPDTTWVTLGNGTTYGVLQLNGQDQTLAGLSAASSSTYNRVINGVSDPAALNLNIVVNPYTGGVIPFSGVLGGEGDDGNFGLTKMGDGVLVLTGENHYTGETTISCGVLRAQDGTGLPAESDLVLAGGVLEGQGTFSRSLGQDPQDPGRVRWTGSGGFSAYGGCLTVNLDTGGTLLWGGEGGFVPSESDLVFGSLWADNEVALTNDIQLGALGVRWIRVDGNCAALPGHLMNGGWVTLGKDGPGTLTVSCSCNTCECFDTFIRSGVVVLGCDQALSECRTVTLGSSSAVLKLDGHSQNVSRLFGVAGRVVNGNSQQGILSFCSPEGSVSTFCGDVGGSGSHENNFKLVKWGLGTQVLEGTNTHSGGTERHEGLLIICRLIGGRPYLCRWGEGATPSGLVSSVPVVPAHPVGEGENQEWQFDTVAADPGGATEKDSDTGCFGVTRVWTNTTQYTPSNPTGNGWALSQWPQIVDAGAGRVVISEGSENRRWFDLVDDEYLPGLGCLDKLTHSDENHEFVLTDTLGNVTRFHDFTVTPEKMRGQFKSLIDPGGNFTHVVEWTGDGDIAEVQCDLGGATDSYVYEYITDTEDPNVGLMSDITHRCKVGTGDWSTVRQLEYTYYVDGDSFGGTGDLKTSVLKDAEGHTLETKYYRYYLPTYGGPRGLLKYTFGGRAFARLAEAVEDPFSAPDEDVAPYADRYLTYDGLHRVTVEVVAGAGNAGLAGGQGTYIYTYDERDGPEEFNVWRYKTVEYLPGYSEWPWDFRPTRTVYANFAGQPMLEVLEGGNDEAKIYTFYRYDDDGRVVWMAQTSAFLPDNEGKYYDAAYADLLNLDNGNYEYLDDDSGLITVIDYYPTTTATEETPGGVEGYLHATSLLNGELDNTPVLQSHIDYIAHVGGGATVYPTNSVAVYQNEDDEEEDGLVTSYTYTWFTDSAQVQSLTVTPRMVPTEQNGSNDENPTTVFCDTFGRPIWTKDADGYIHYAAYGPATGAVIKTITDVKYGALTDPEKGSFANTGWDEPESGLHLVTLYEVDPEGRTTKLTDPNGNVTYTVYNDIDCETRVYAGWNASTNRPTGPTMVYRDDRAHGYFEALAISTAPYLTNGRPDGTETFVTADIQSLSRSYTNPGGQTIKGDWYFDLTDPVTHEYITYSEEPDLGTAGVNFLRTTYAYDPLGLLCRTQDPTGTIRRIVHDSLGRAVSDWVGTDDTPEYEDYEWCPPAGFSFTVSTNMVKVVAYAYEDGVGGTRLLSQATAYAGENVSYVTAYRYDWRGRRTNVRGPDDVAVRTTYDNLGHATVVETYADANKNFVIDSGELRGKVEQSFDVLGRVYRTLTYEVDPTTGAAGNHLTADAWYGPRGLVIKTADANGLFQKVQYDGAGRAVVSYLSYDDDEDTYTETYDSDSRSVKVDGDTVIEQTQRIYDPGSRLVASLSFRRFDGDTNTEGELTAANAYATGAVTWYDRANRVTHTAAYGRETGEGTRYIFDTDGSIIDEENNGQGDGIPDEAQGTPREPNTSDDYIVGKLEYDDAGRAYRSTDNLARVNQTEYDLLGRVTKTIANYVDGVLTETETDTDQTTEFIYDSAGRLSIQRARNPKGDDNDPNHENIEDQETRYLYESEVDRSWVTNVIYPDSSDTDGPYQSVTSLTSVYDWPDSTVTATVANHGYSVGDVVRIRGADQAEYNGWFTITGVTTDTFTYTIGGWAISPATGTITVKRLGDDQIKTTYDRLGRKVTVTDQRGVEHTYAYDEAGRLTSDAVTNLGRQDQNVDGSVRRIEWAYDDLGRVSAVTSYNAASGGTAVNGVDYTYNGWGAVTASYQDHAGAAGTGDPAVLYEYDDTDPENPGAVPYVRLVSVTYPGGRAVYYNYPDTGVGAVLSRLDNIAATDDPQEEDVYAAYAYLGAATIVAVSHPAVAEGDGLTLSYGSSGTYSGWDRFGRVVDQTWKVGTTAVDSYGYTYDRNSNRLTRTNLLNGDLDETYTYDGLDRLLTMDRDDGFDQDWTLDALGNWSSFDDNGTSQDREHDAANQITDIDGQAAWVTPEYDAAGNMTSGPQPGDETTELRFVYDAWNRLVKVTDDSETPVTIAEYQFDGQGRRVQKTVEGNPDVTYDYYFNENWQVLETRVGSDPDPLDQYVWDVRYIDAPVVRFHDANTDGDYLDAGDNTLYYTQDANWNVTALVDAATGDVVERYMYAAYGKPTVLDEEWEPVEGNQSAVGNERLFQGQESDAETGLNNVRNRIYHVTLAVFLERDGWYIDGMNLYQYCRSNPAALTDPMGLCGESNQAPDPYADYDEGWREWNECGEGAEGPRGDADDLTLTGPGAAGNLTLVAAPGAAGNLTMTGDPAGTTGPYQGYPTDSVIAPNTNVSVPVGAGRLDLMGNPVAPPPPPSKPATQQESRTLADKQMRVTFYIDKGNTSGTHEPTRPGTVAAADTSWRRDSDGREFRVHEDGTPKKEGEIMPARPAFPYGSNVTVYDGDRVIYQGTVQDTGRGHIRHGVQADEWIDVWYPSSGEGRRNLKKEYYRVVVEAPEPPKGATKR